MIGHASRKLFPPPYISPTFSTSPRFASGPNPSPTFPHLFVAMANPHNLPQGTQPAAGSLPSTPPSLRFRVHPRQIIPSSS